LTLLPSNSCHSTKTALPEKGVASVLDTAMIPHNPERLARTILVEGLVQCFLGQDGVQELEKILVSRA
jgi:hypothetical protein